MGKKKIRHIIVVITLLALACFGVYFKSDKSVAAKQVSRQSVLQNIQGYTFLGQEPIEENIISVLELDDYTNATYRKDGHTIGLYIGYYFLQEKVSAPHSPLVCLPGSGWQLGIQKKSHLLVDSHDINYEQFIARKGSQKSLVMYWFQAHEKTSPGVFKNKINATINLLTGKKEEHAFVRVTIPLAGMTQDEARDIGEDFTKQFYPVFLDYIND